MNILVLGATGATGRLIVNQALTKGHAVVALVRSKARAADLAGAELVEGDARDADALTRAVASCDAVVSSLGSAMSPFREVTMLSMATRALVGVMVKPNIRRLVCITGIGAGDSRGHGGFFYDKIFQPLLLGTIYADKDREEELIKGSAADWLIVRPGFLTNGPRTAVYRAITDLSGVTGGKISRADVADFILNQLESPSLFRQTPLLTY